MGRKRKMPPDFPSDYTLSPDERETTYLYKDTPAGVAKELADIAILDALAAKKKSRPRLRSKVTQPKPTSKDKGKVTKSKGAVAKATRGRQTAAAKSQTNSVGTADGVIGTSQVGAKLENKAEKHQAAAAAQADAKASTGQTDS